MQTFLPFPDVDASAAVLDDRRLGKQRVEVLQVLRALHIHGYGWATHPAVTMWRGHTAALVAYGVAVVDEWARRGHDDSTRDPIAEFVHPHGPAPQARLAERGALPPWWGWEPLHRSHRSALLRKDPVHYGPLLPPTPDDLPYEWPPPPAPPAPPPTVGAWVVRGHRGAATVSLAAQAGEAQSALAGPRRGRQTKRIRQVRRFIEEIHAGDPLVVPEGDVLHVGVVEGPYRRAVARHVRPVRWVGEVPRSALTFPAGLQDPQAVFGLHAEAVVTDVTGGRSVGSTRRNR